MNKKEKHQYKKEINSQNKEFLKRLTPLLRKDFIASMHYEDTLVAEDGKAYVNVDLTKIDSPFSIFSYEKRMNPEIFDYIDTQVYYLRAAIPVVINFDDGGKYSQELKDKIRKYVIRHYTLEYEDKRIESNKTVRFSFLLLLVGILMLILHFISVFAFRESPSTVVINELTLICSWMLIWQSTDFFFVSGHDRRIEIYNSGQLALAEITFGKPRYIK